MLDACFRCGLMSAKWRGINLSLIYWPCSVHTAPGAGPAARTRFWHRLIPVSPRTARVSSENLPLRQPDPSLDHCQRLFAFVCPCWIAQFVFKVWVKGVTMFGTIPSYIHDRESDKLTWTRRTATILHSAFLPLGKTCHLCVLMMSSKKAFGIYWYIYSPWQSTRGQVYQQYLIPFSWNTEDEDRQGLNPCCRFSPAESFMNSFSTNR